MPYDSKKHSVSVGAVAFFVVGVATGLAVPRPDEVTVITSTVPLALFDEQRQQIGWLPAGTAMTAGFARNDDAGGVAHLPVVFATSNDVARVTVASRHPVHRIADLVAVRAEPLDDSPARDGPSQVDTRERGQD